MNPKSLRGFGPVGTNGPEFPLIISVNFSNSHVGTASFRGMIVHYFMEYYKVENYQEWLHKAGDGARLCVHGLKQCADISTEGGFYAFIDDMAKWMRENPNMPVIFE